MMPWVRVKRETVWLVSDQSQCRMQTAWSWIVVGTAWEGMVLLCGHAL